MWWKSNWSPAGNMSTRVGVGPKDGNGACCGLHARGSILIICAVETLNEIDIPGTSDSRCCYSGEVQFKREILIEVGAIVERPGKIASPVIDRDTANNGVVGLGT